MKIVLIGFMGSGKTSIAKKLSEILDLPVIEMDDRVLQKTKTGTMHDVFVKGGESLLRETEMIIAKENAFAHNVIISTGGGCVMNETIFTHFRSTPAKIFFLNASFHTCATRLKGQHDRPLFQDLQHAENLYQQRYPLYLKYADYLIETENKSIDEISHAIIQLIKKN